MTSFYHELPTTGAVSFSDFLEDKTGAHTAHISQATSSRAGLRSVLKETKRMGAEKDYLRVIKVVDEYLPYLYAILASVTANELAQRSIPKFSWRSTLSSHTFKSSPRVEGAGLHYELSFTLLTYAFALSDLARATVITLGSYEQERHASEAERKQKDDQLNFAARLLCKAGGIYRHIADTILPEWDKVASEGGYGRLADRPPDVSSELLNALSKLALADAHLLAIRKLMSRTTAESAIELGSHLPKSHPAPALLAKLYVYVNEQYTAARSLILTYMSKPASEGSSGDIDSDLRKYVTNQSALALAQTYKWLGIDAGEQERTGQAVAFLTAAKEELGNAKTAKEGKDRGVTVDSKDKGKAALPSEVDAINQYLKKYTATNDTILFQPVPAVSLIRSMVPTGRSVLDIKPFTEPTAAFLPVGGPDGRRGSGLVPAHDDDARLAPQRDGIADSSETGDGSRRDKYAGAGQYF